jgi:(1->4)-alpha-D-glucan 1-alpha-D-glucosylmutase
MPIDSTYRVQFHAKFTFRDATAIIPYLAELGITHLYASPYLRATPGSTHGYDVIDHCRLNPELGTEADFDAMLDALKRNGMGHILDVVPNHVGIATNENNWFNDVLAHGPASRYAPYFDIAWRDSPRPELKDKILLPLLGNSYAEVLEKGELKLVREDGSLFVRYYDRRFPIDPATAHRIDPDRLNGTPGDARSFDALHELLEKQHYRLAYWKNASDEINYRRFFDVNSLAALSMERQEVFDDTHALIFRLLDAGQLDGLRIDHPDGLYDPKQYFQRLQKRYAQGTGGAPTRPASLYILGEKILAMGEALPGDWPIAGTSGYDALILINSLFVDRSKEDAFTDLYRDFTGLGTRFDQLVYEKKLLILDISLASELTMLAHQLDRLAQRHRQWRDFTLAGIREGLRQVIACFPVYRTYVDRAGANETDRRHMALAVNEAARRNPRIDERLFRFIYDAAMQVYPATATDDDKAAQLRFAGKLQQLTAPTMAKGVEDTAFYCYHRLISLNEVGGEPAHFGIDPQTLHAWLADRQRQWPSAMNTLSTHDTKRSEDVRARINVLSELPEEWSQHLNRWSELNASIRTGPAPASDEEYLLYQTLLGAWPIGDALPADFAGRIKQYMTKALREAKLRTSWTAPNETHEKAIHGFIDRLLTWEPFLADFRPFQQRIARFGMINSLAQTLLKLTAPGVPDTYQGTELWDLSLVDPDNRRPVDYAARAELLRSLDTAKPAELLTQWTDGRIKLLITTRALHARRRLAPLFIEGEYVPLEPQGALADHAFAFARRLGEAVAVVIVPRLVTGLEDGWADTTVTVPTARLRNAFTGRTVEGGSLALRDALGDVPVGLWTT